MAAARRAPAAAESADAGPRRPGPRSPSRRATSPASGAGEQADGGHAWSRQFALLLAEALTGVRPVRQILPWLSQRGSVHLYRLLPRFSGGRRARVQRVMTAQPSPDVIEMTLMVAVGPRTRALAVRLARAEPTPPQPRGRSPPGPRMAGQRATARWLCTDIEAA